MQPVKEKLKEKIVAFFEQEGIGKVSERIGISTQALRDLRSGRNAVTLDTLLAFYAGYPEQFGPIVQESLGIGANVSSVPVSETAETTIAQLTNEVSRWSHRYDRLERRYDDTQEKLNNVLKKYVPELSFLESGNHVTAKAEPARPAEEAQVYQLVATERTLIGFGNRGKVLVHPATQQYVEQVA